MQLKLDPSDLRPEFQSGSRKSMNLDQGISIKKVNFDKLNERAQAAVRIVGKATFYAFGRKTHNVIYPPCIDRDHSRVPTDPQTEFMMAL